MRENELNTDRKELAVGLVKGEDLDDMIFQDEEYHVSSR